MSIQLAAHNGIIIKTEISSYPDQTKNIRFKSDFLNLTSTKKLNIIWNYESDTEMATIYFITKELQSRGFSIHLHMPYIPNARMDRVNETDEVFTLKHFASFINDLNFKTVQVLDAHSPVSLALIDRVIQLDVKPYIEQAIKSFKPDVLFMPDEGAHKRYSSMFPTIPSTFGIKHRDWRTGKITNYEVAESEMVENQKVLIVDDISSRGGTFMFAAKALKAVNAGAIGLYITHCEETIRLGNVLDSNSPIEQVYTANPLFSKETKNEKLQKIKILD